MDNIIQIVEKLKKLDEGELSYIEMMLDFVLSNKEQENEQG